LCQSHYLKNIAEPIAEKDEAMKLELRKAVRASVGPLIRSEHVENPGVLTVTGLLPSSVETPVENGTPDVIQSTSDKQMDERDIVVESIQQRVRYLLTLKGRPPFRLAGVEMYERLSEVDSCLLAMLKAHEDVRLDELHVGISAALQGVTDTYAKLRQAADWLFKISNILEPEDKPVRTGEQVKQELQTHIEVIVQQSERNPCLSKIASKIKKTTVSYAPGLFHTYDVEELPRTNNERESEHRRIMCQLLKTTGQKGAVRRMIQRSGAWEAIPRPDTLSQAIEGLATVDPEDLRKERKRVRNHRNRFRTHTRSAKQSQKQLGKLREQWCKLAA
jgi:hypothetical protein